MKIERFLWTEHALERLDERHLTRGDVEQAIRDGHDTREINDGQADWLLTAITTKGVAFEAIYDHPAHGDQSTVRIVSTWRQPD
jgi:Domain of unknown function (DUF4258)